MDLFRKYLKEMIEENPVTSRKFVPVEKLKPKVLRNALSTFAWGCTTDKVIALYDTSFFNRGKSGYLLADDAFYLKPQQNTPTSTGGEMNAGIC